MIFHFFPLFSISINEIRVSSDLPTSLDLPGKCVLVPLNHTNFSGTISTNSGTQNVFGDSIYYILNCTVATTLILYPKSYSSLFMYYLFPYSNCQMTEIFINPPNNHIFRVSDDSESNVTMKNNQKICLWYIFEPNQIFTLHITNDGLEVDDTISYSLGMNKDSIHYPITGTQAVTPLYSVLSIFFQTDNSKIKGSAFFTVDAPLLPNSFHPNQSNMMCVNFDDSSSQSLSCSWETLPDRSSWNGVISDDESVLVITLPICAIVVLVLVFIIGCKTCGWCEKCQKCSICHLSPPRCCFSKIASATSSSASYTAETSDNANSPYSQHFVASYQRGDEYVQSSNPLSPYSKHQQNANPQYVDVQIQNPYD